MTKDTMLTALHELLPEGSLTTFLYDDIWAFLKSLHYYKIRHVYDNREYFVQYVQGLDSHYTSLLEWETEGMRDWEISSEASQTENISPCINATQARSVIEGMFILSCMEFTCACPERMMMMQMERVRK